MCTCVSTNQGLRVIKRGKEVCQPLCLLRHPLCSKVLTTVRYACLSGRASRADSRGPTASQCGWMRQLCWGTQGAKLIDTVYHNVNDKKLKVQVLPAALAWSLERMLSNCRQVRLLKVTEGLSRYRSDIHARSTSMAGGLKGNDSDSQPMCILLHIQI